MDELISYIEDDITWCMLFADVVLLDETSGGVN